MQRKRRLAAALAILGLGGVPALLLAAGTTETAPPPKFSSDVTDAFYSDARTKIGPGQPGAVVPPTTAATTPGGAPATAAASTGGTWSKLISSESLESEVKAQLPLTQEAVKTLAGFKGEGHHHARNTYSYLAVLFEVIAEYDGEVRWKKDSPGIRDRFSQVGFNCKTSSDATFNESKARSTDLADLLGGQTIDLPATAEPTRAFGQLAGRPPLMIRMEEARKDKLGLWTSDKNSFSKFKPDLLREGQALAMLAKIIQDPEFEFGDDETYLGYAVELQKQCQALIDAVNLDNQEAAQSAVGAISKACDTCHGDYR